MTTINITLDMDDLDQSTVTISRSPDGAVVIRKNRPAPDADGAVVDEELADDAVLASIFDRWQVENPQSGAFELVSRLRERRIDIVAPKPRVEDKKAEPYVRLLTRSKSGMNIAAYINTASVIVNRNSLRAVAADMPGADVKANGVVYFDVHDVEGCLAVVDRLMAL